jgi:hypothetical protein
MSFIQLHGIADVKEAKHVPEGRYPLIVTSAQLKDSKKEDDAQNILCILEVEDSIDPKPAPVFHYVALPRGKDAMKDQQMLLMAKRFFVQFDIPIDNGIELEQITGCRADGFLKVEEYPEGSGNMKNTLQLDRLPSED